MEYEERERREGEGKGRRGIRSGGGREIGGGKREEM